MSTPPVDTSDVVREMRCTHDEMPITKAGRDANGFFRVRGRVSAPGVYEYMRDGKLRRELKPPEELYSPEHLDSVKGAVVTNEHPKGGAAVNPDNSGELQKGHSSSEPEVGDDGMDVDLVVTDKSLIADIEARRKTGISLGKRNWFDETPGVWTAKDGSQHPYDRIQRGMITNHIAIVRMGRVPTARLQLDSKDTDSRMNETTITVDGVDIRVGTTEAGVVTAAIKRRDDELGGWQGRFDKARETYDSVEAERDEAVKLRDAMTAERDVATEKLKTADSVDIDALVAERIAFLDRAKAVLTADNFEKTKSGTSMEIMRFTCDAHDIDVSSKSDAYVEARFDSLVDIKSQTNDSELSDAVINPAVQTADSQHYNEANKRLAEARAKRAS